MATYNKRVPCHPTTHPLAFLVGNARKRKVFDFIHPHTFGPSQDVRLFVAVIGMAGTGESYLINMIWQLFTDRAATSALKVTAPTSRRRQHLPRATMRFHRRHAVYSTRLEVGHFTVVNVKISNTSRNSV